MASYQKMYLHAAGSAIGGTLPGAASQSATAPYNFATNAYTNRSMDNVIGSAQTSQSIPGTSYNTVTGQPTIMGRWVSQALNAATFGSGTWTVSAAALESSTNANFTFTGGVCYLWRPGTGARIGYYFDLPLGGATEPGATQTAVSTNHSGANQTAQAGDVIIFEAWFDCTVAPSMGAVYTASLFYDGATEASTTNCAAFLNAPAAISFQDPAVVPNTLNKQKVIGQAVQRAAVFFDGRKWKRSLWTPYGEREYAV